MYFIVVDDRVNEIVGPHVIQIFFSLDIAEEVQIKVRTARNGGSGSFSMVLNQTKLNQQFNISSWNFPSDEKIYNILNDKRKQIQTNYNQTSLKQRVQETTVLV